MKKIAICLAGFNGGNYIKNQIDSIINQLNSGDCIFFSDDGSTDKTLEIVSSYEQVKIINTLRVGGVVENFNRLLSYVFYCAPKYDYIVLCDQDDVWLPNRLEEVRATLNVFDCMHLNGIVVDENLHSKNSTIFDLYPPKIGVIENLIKNSYIGCCMAFRIELLKLALPIPKLTPWHDWYIGLIAEMYYSVGQSSVISMCYRRHASNASSTGSLSKNSLYSKILMRVLMTYSILMVMIRANCTDLKRS